MRVNTTLRNHIGVPLIAAGVAVLATACGGSSSGGNTASVGTGSGGSTAAAVTTHSGPNGSYVTDASGRTLYMFSKDTGTTSTCSGGCATEWPAYTQNGTQVVYKGHPMYYFAGDSAAGDTKGEGINNFGGLWSMVTPSGTSLTMAQPSSSPSSSSGGSSSTWG